MIKPKSFLKKASLLLASGAMAIAMTPAIAMADTPTIYGDQTKPDNIIGITWTEDDTTHTATVDLDDEDLFTATTSPIKGALYKDKSGYWHVLGTNKYLELSNVLAHAYCDTGDKHAASEAWSSGKTLTFNVWNKDKQTSKWSCAEYSKYKDFTYANIQAATDFYTDTTKTTLGSTTESATQYSDMLLALSSGSSAISSTAGGDLASLTMSSDDSPRVMWGYLAGATGGNRFPSNIDSITIK